VARFAAGVTALAESDGSELWGEGDEPRTLDLTKAVRRSNLPIVVFGGVSLPGTE
jgi:hypothetical protein